MKYKEISVRLKRDIRHEPYNVSQCECTLTAAVEGDLEEAYKELHEDAIIIIEEMEATERMKFKLTHRDEED